MMEKTEIDCDEYWETKVAFNTKPPWLRTRAHCYQKGWMHAKTRIRFFFLSTGGEAEAEAEAEGIFLVSRRNLRDSPKDL